MALGPERLRTRLRFAPSPTGSLHLGVARTAVVNWIWAQAEKAELVLRIDDTDAERSKSALEAKLLADLKWLGLTYTGQPLRQSERIDLHRSAAARLQAHTYEHEGALYFSVPERSFSYRDLVKGEIALPPGAIKDFVILRSDGTPTYNFATAVDDAELGITHVVRGEDHVSNTPLQILVIEALAANVPCYAHIPLLMGPQGAKLSKRHGATSLADYRRQGFLPQALVNYLALVSFSYGEQEVASRLELVKSFDVQRIHRAAARFDTDKLRWLNGQHIRALDLAQFGSLMAERLGRAATEAELEALQSAGATLQECAEAARLFAGGGELTVAAKDALLQEGALAALEYLRQQLPDDELTPSGAAELLKNVRSTLKAEGVAPKIAMKAIRAALTGSTEGPELHYFLAALPVEELRKRLNFPHDA